MNRRSRKLVFLRGSLHGLPNAHRPWWNVRVWLSGHAAKRKFQGNSSRSACRTVFSRPSTTSSSSLLVRKLRVLPPFRRLAVPRCSCESQHYNVCIWQILIKGSVIAERNECCEIVPSKYTWMFNEKRQAKRKTLRTLFNHFSLHRRIVWDRINEMLSKVAIGRC